MLGTIMKNHVRYPSGSQVSWGSGQTLVSAEWLECRPWEMGKPYSERRRHRRTKLVPKPTLDSRLRTGS